MESGSSPGISKSRIAAYITATVFCLFVIYYTMMALISPGRKISSINKEFGYISPENTEVEERIFSDSAFVRLNRDRAFYQARITMAETDSISLSLNLADSSPSLEINGVSVHRAKIPWFRMSRVFNMADEYAISSMLSKPFIVEYDLSTIKKEPLMLKIAPKDTSEYKPDILPDTSNVQAVNYMLEMENGFRLYVYEVEDNGKAGGGLRRFLFDLNDRFRNSWDLTRSLLTFRVPEYHPYIRIRLPKADARIIYRGLPRQGQVSLYR